MSDGNTTTGRRWLLTVLLLALVTGCYNVGTSLGPSFRECQTAMVTRNLWLDGPIGLFYSRIDWFGNAPGYMLLEFPLYNAVVAAFYAVAGPRDWLGQIVSVLCSLGMVALFYGIVRRLEGERTALVAAALMALTPLQQCLGQAVLPEPMLMLCLVASLYTMVRYAEGGPGGWLALASLLAGAATLVKAPAGLVLLGPLLFLAWTRFGWGALRRPTLWLAAAFALGVYFFWQRHADSINALHYPFYLSTSPEQKLWVFGTLAMRWDWQFYARIAGRLFVYLSPMIVLAAAVAIFKRPANSRAWLWHVWLAANAGYVLLCANLHFRHKHYQIVFVPVFAALAARAVVAWWPRRRMLVLAGAVLLLAYDAQIGWRMWREQQDSHMERACAALREVSAPQDLVVAATFDGPGGLTGNHHNAPVWLYHAARRGWNAPMYEHFDLAAVERYRQQGARWLLLDLWTQRDGAAGGAARNQAVWSRVGSLLGMAERPPSRPDERLLELAKELAVRYRCVRSVEGEFAVFDLRAR
ncbi:MAG: glycosyltransferase family 39 protein [Verrucomicrobia bacterium]|nr:glycosyltransferase family 39 protein [Verrucomicrobiota bacterium]